MRQLTNDVRQKIQDALAQTETAIQNLTAQREILTAALSSLPSEASTQPGTSEAPVQPGAPMPPTPPGAFVAPAQPGAPTPPTPPGAFVAPVQPGMPMPPAPPGAPEAPTAMERKPVSAFLKPNLDAEAIKNAAMPMRTIKEHAKISQILFSAIFPDHVGMTLDAIFDAEGWELQFWRKNGWNGWRGYQVYLGEGVSVDNYTEYVFPYLYQRDELQSWAKSFYDYRMKRVQKKIPKTK